MQALWIRTVIIIIMEYVRSLSYVKMLSELSPVVVFLFGLVASSCDVKHNNDNICKTTSPVFCFLVDGTTSQK